VARVQGREGVCVPVDSIRLEIDGSIPFESESLERRKKLVRETRNAALMIEVIDAKQPPALGVARAQVAPGSS